MTTPFVHYVVLENTQKVHNVAVRYMLTTPCTFHVQYIGQIL